MRLKALLVLGSEPCVLFIISSLLVSFDTQSPVGWLLACLTSQQHASVSPWWICSDNCTCCHTEISCRSNFPSHPVPARTLLRQVPGRVAITVSIVQWLVWLNLKTDPIAPGAWQGSQLFSDWCDLTWKQTLLRQVPGRGVSCSVTGVTEPENRPYCARCLAGEPSVPVVQWLVWLNLKTDPTAPGAWQGSHQSVSCSVTDLT